MTRSEVREHIFRLIFRVEFNNAEEMKSQVDEYFTDLLKEDLSSDAPEDNDKLCFFSEKEENYIKDKFNNIIDRLPEIDGLINDNSKGWNTTRVGKVDLAILRLAVYELKFDDSIPVGVAIDQAVELAKKYGQDASAAFINGILAGIAKTLEDNKEAATVPENKD